MEDGYIVLLVIYAALALFKKVAGKGKGAPAQGRPQARPKPTTMDELLREMQGQMGIEQEEELEVDELPARREDTRMSSRSGPSEQGARWDVEERESLEVEATVFERVVVERPAPVVFDQDDGALELVRQRVAYAEARNRAWNPEDHKKFDAKIRVVAPEVVRAPKATNSLRQAMIWHEILGKPIALRDDAL